MTESISIKKIFLDKWLISAFFIGLIIRIAYIDGPIKFDEASTFLGYIESENFFRLFLYDQPNNHILHSLLAKIFYTIFGFSLPIIRLVAFFSGVFSIPIIYLICKNLNQNGRIAAISFATYPLYIEYSTNARGYTLQTFIFLLIILLVIRNYNLLNNYKNNLIALFIALATLTIPTFVYLMPGIFIWIFFINYNFQKTYNDNKEFLNRFLKLILKSLLISTLFYLPVFLISGNLTKTYFSNLTSLSISDFLSLNVPYFVSNLEYYFANNNTILIPFYFILFFTGFLGYLKNKNKIGLFLLPSLFLGIALVFYTKLSLPLQRTWFFLPAIFIIIADNGFSLFISNFSEKLKSLFLLLVFCSLTISLKSNVLINSPFNLEADKGYEDSYTVIKMIDKYRADNNLDELNLYTNVYNSLGFHIQIWKENYPLILCNKSIKKISFRETFKKDFEKYFEEDKPYSKTNSEKISKYSFYIHLKHLKKINLGYLKGNSNKLIEPDQFFISLLKGEKELDNSIFTLYRFDSAALSKCTDEIPSTLPKINNRWSSTFERINKKD